MSLTFPAPSHLALTLREMLKHDFDPVLYFGEAPLLLCKGPNSLNLFESFSPEDSQMDTAQILVGDRVLNGYTSPEAVVIPLKSSSASLGQEITLGRGAWNAVRLSDSSVSRSHCRFCPPGEGEGDVWRITDQGSANGTWVNGVEIQPGEAVQVFPSGEVEIRIGEVEVALILPLGLQALLSLLRRVLAEDQATS